MTDATRPIKFRAWNGTSMVSHQLLSLTMNGDLRFDSGECGIKQCSFPIMQFTGLHDKNGVEIYFGDILDFDEREWGGPFKPEVLKFTGSFFDWPYSGSAGDVCEYRQIIGNIHENPELLETSHD